MFGVAGFTAATDCFYFAVMAEYFMVAGYNFDSAVNNTAYTADYSYFATEDFTSCADDFVSAIVGFAAMAEYFTVGSTL
jgi:hypothetical protein